VTSLTRRGCERICALGPDALSPEVRGHARRLVLDGSSVALAGTVQERAPAVLAALVRGEGAAPAASERGSWGCRRVAPQAAAR
jgi:hypothetical protein